MASYIWKALGMFWSAPPTAPDERSAAEAGHADSSKTGILHDLVYNMDVKKARTVGQAFSTLASGEPMDDKELLLEHGVEMLQTLPLDSGLSAKVSDSFIKLLWDDLPHPPATFAGPETRHRRHDGGNNNLWAPEMGKAGSPYCRSVPPTTTKGPSLPDPELVFEKLLKRKDNEFRPHPSGLNRLFFSFATIVIHECFQTNRKNQWINDTSSYVDLSTLYGNDQEGQERVRTYKNGLIYPDSIASERIMLMPPGVVALLIMFSRNHNVIADNLLTINEQGQYGPWDSLDDEHKKRQDEDIFQIARNINVGFFATVVLRDYVAAILNTPRADSTWSLDLGKEIKQGTSRIDRGSGNVVSVEFAVLYHWHATLSAADADWMGELIKWNLPEVKSLDEITPAHFHKIIMQEAKRLFPAKEKCRTWTFDDLKRGEDGRFADADLAKIIKDCIEEPAHAFGAHGTPASLRVVDLMGQLQAREVFNVCTLNEFRKYLNLKPYATFKEWAEDDDVAREAELLYGHIDHLELYPGLQAECTKPAIAGSGVCPGQTTGRGILDDAVALVRGDRFLTYDMNSSTLTNWGVQKLGDLPGGAYGGMLAKLLFTGLPGSFGGTSSYALVPFYTPQALREILKNNGVLDQYNMERPPEASIVGIHTQEGCKKIFEDRENFRVMYQKAIRVCTDGHDFMIGWDDQQRHDDRSAILHKAFFEPGFEKNVSQWYGQTVRDLIKKSSIAYHDSRRSINIVRDVTNVAPILWLAERFAIPLKTKETPRGLVTRSQLFDIYLILFIYQSFNISPAAEWKLRESAGKVAPILRKIFETHLKTQSGGMREGIVDWLEKGSAFEVKEVADRFYHALNDTGLDIGDLVGDCIGMGAPVAGNITQQASLLIDLFLSEKYKEYKDRIVELVHKDDDASNKELEGFVWEGMRHAGVVPGLPRVAAKDIVVHDGARGSVQIKQHQTVLVATSRAAMDPAAFPDPEKLDPHRSRSSYTLLGHGLHFCFGARLVAPALVATLREVFKLKNLRRAPGKQGQFNTLEHDIAGVKTRLYLDANAKESPIPTTLVLQYDE